ncbi:MAG TPA: F0F1 ATP synthase subunit A [Opitutaceae bacterium]|jgi:F-type H+-transporting ATPase subunit a
MARVTKLAIASASLFAGTRAFAEGVEPAARQIFSIGPLPVTNSIVTSWVVAVALIIVIRLAIKRPKLIPTKSQAVVEATVQGILDLTSPIVGKKVAKPVFPLLIGLFTFILIQNWSGLFPGVGTVYMRSHQTGEWMEFVRPSNADLNGPLALSMISFVAWLYFILRYAGPAFIIRDLFGNKADKKDTPLYIYYPLYLIFFAAGIIEIVSIMFRPVSLSFRLYGNMFGGENLMHSMSSIMKWGLPVPFYFMEMMTGLIQAFIFTVLVTVYIGLMTNHGDGHEEAHH